MSYNDMDVIIYKIKMGKIKILIDLAVSIINMITALISLLTIRKK